MHVGIFVVGFLLILAAIVVVTVVRLVPKTIVPIQQLKSSLSGLLWIVPAIAVVVLITRENSAMQQSPNFFHTELPAKALALLGSFGFAIVGFLLFLAVVVIISVLRSSPKQIFPVQQVKSAFSVLLWIVPAAAVVVLIGMKTGAALTGTVPDNSSAQASVERAIELESTSGPVLLRIQQQSSDPPDWAAFAQKPTEDESLVVLSSGRFVTIDEVEQDVTGKAHELVTQKFRNEYPVKGDFDVPVALIDRHAVKGFVAQQFRKDFGKGIEADMYQGHLKLELTTALRDAVYANWRGQLIERRLVSLGSIAGLVTLMLATAAGYLRLDDLTGGAFRRRLKLAAASVIAAGSVIAIRFVS